MSIRPSENWQLTTERLSIRLLTANDAPFILALLNSSSWLEFIGDRNVHTIGDAEEYIRDGALRSYQECGFGSYLVTLTETGQSIGTCGLHQRTGLPDIDLGFAFLPEFAGKGYGYEAASAVLIYGASTLGIARLLALCDANNKVSIALIKKLGFQYQGSVKLLPEKESLLYDMAFQKESATL